MSNRIRLTKVASFTKELDRIADEVQEQDPKIALAIDMISDHMERKLSTEQKGIDPKRLKNSGIQEKDPDFIDNENKKVIIQWLGGKDTFEANKVERMTSRELAQMANMLMNLHNKKQR